MFYWSHFCEQYNMEMSVRSVIYIQTLFVVLVKGFLFNQYGEVRPNNPVRLVGENITFYCHLSDQAFNASLLFFEKDEGEIQTDAWLDEAARTLVLPVMVTDIGKNGKFVYNCFLNTTPSVLPVGAQNLRTEYWPANVSNFTCVVYDWDQGMTCSWQHGVKYVYDIKAVAQSGTLHKYTNVRVKWGTRNDSDVVNPCPILTATSCTWTTGYGTSNLTVFVEIEVFNMARNISNVTHINFKPVDYVKPDPVAYMQSNPVNSTCINVTWKHGKPGRDKKYRLTYSSRWHDSKTLLYPNQTDHVTLCDLHPFTKYNFSIDVHPTFGGFWSETNTTEEWTLSSAPSSSPESHPGSYHYDQQECEHGIFRKVTFFWKKLDEWYWNDEQIDIEIHVHRVGDPENQVEVKGFIPVNRKSESVIVNCKDVYDVRIYAKNSIGLSVNSTVVRVSEYTKGVTPPLARVEIPEILNETVDHDVFVRWTPSQVPDVSSYTVFWCEADITGCKDFIQWRDYGTAEDLPVSIHINTSENLNFGVSTQTVDGLSSGFKWETNLYIRDIVPLTEPQMIRFTDPPKDLSLAVQWNALEHVKFTSPYIEQYVVHYCPVSDRSSKVCTDTDGAVSVPGDHLSAVIENLKEDVLYGIYVTAKSEAGEGPHSDWVYGIPVFTGLKAGSIAAIVIGGAFGLAFCIAGIIFCIRYFKKKWKACTKGVEIKPPPISVLPGNEIDEHPNTGNTVDEHPNTGNTGSYTPLDCSSSNPAGGEITFTFPVENSHQKHGSDDSGYVQTEQPENPSKTDRTSTGKIKEDDYVRATAATEHIVLDDKSGKVTDSSMTEGNGSYVPNSDGVKTVIGRVPHFQMKELLNPVYLGPEKVDVSHFILHGPIAPRPQVQDQEAVSPETSTGSVNGNYLKTNLLDGGKPMDIISEERSSPISSGTPTGIIGDYSKVNENGIEDVLDDGRGKLKEGTAVSSECIADTSSEHGIPIKQTRCLTNGYVDNTNIIFSCPGETETENLENGDYVMSVKSVVPANHVVSGDPSNGPCSSIMPSNSGYVAEAEEISSCRETTTDSIASPPTSIVEKDCSNLSTVSSMAVTSQDPNTDTVSFSAAQEATAAVSTYVPHSHLNQFQNGGGSSDFFQPIGTQPKVVEDISDGQKLMSPAKYEALGINSGGCVGEIEVQRTENDMPVLRTKEQITPAQQTSPIKGKKAAMNSNGYVTGEEMRKAEKDMLLSVEEKLPSAQQTSSVEQGVAAMNSRGYVTVHI